MTTSSHDAAHRQQFTQAVESAFYQNSPLGQFQKVAVNVMLSLFANTIEVFYRWNFGERYLRLGWLFVSAVLFVGLSYLLGPALASPFMVDPSNATIGQENWIFVLAFLAAGFLHRFTIFYRNWYIKEVRHSYGSGGSWLFSLTQPLKERLPFDVPINDATQRYIEPLLAVFVGFVVWLSGSGFLGLWLMAAGIALMLKENTKHQAIRNNYLNVQDAQIESEATAALLSKGWVQGEANPQRSFRYKGYSAIIPLPAKSEETDVTLETMYPAETEIAKGSFRKHKQERHESDQPQPTT